MEHHKTSTAAHSAGMKGGENHYRALGIMAALSFIAMYILMYAMVNALENVYMNFNQVYMAGLMASPMVLIELVVMRGMYHDKRLNALIAGAAVIVGALFFVFIRSQTAIGDRQFLRSMIPHHASAILMCTKATVSDPKVKSLCRDIEGSQQEQIDRMKSMLASKAD